MIRRFVLLSAFAVIVLFTAAGQSLFNGTYAPFTDADTISGNVSAGYWAGNIEISKNTDPNDGTDFTFTPSATAPATISGAAFTLEDDGVEGVNPSSKTYSGLDAPGTYHFTETPHPNYTLSMIACQVTVNGPGTTTVTYTGADPDAAFQDGDTTANVTLGAGDTVKCIFTNTLSSGSITIIKDVKMPDGSETNTESFPFTTAGDGLSDFTLGDDGAGPLLTTKVFSDLASGGLRTIEETEKIGWVISDISCTSSGGSTITVGASGGFDSGDNTVTVQLAGGDDVTCTFTNLALPESCTTDFKQPNPTTVYAPPGGAMFAPGNFDQVIVGTEGNDWLVGGNNLDCIIGKGGDDRLYGGNAKDFLDGGAGTDYCDGGGHPQDDEDNCEAFANLEVSVADGSDDQDDGGSGANAGWQSQAVYTLTNAGAGALGGVGNLVTFGGSFTSPAKTGQAITDDSGNWSCTINATSWSCSGWLAAGGSVEITIELVGGSGSTGTVTFTPAAPTCPASSGPFPSGCVDATVSNSNTDGDDLNPTHSDTIS